MLIPENAQWKSFPEALELNNYVTRLSAFQQALMELWEVTPDLASESSMPLFEPGTEVLRKTFGSGGQSLEPLWEGPYQMGLIIYVTLLLLTPKVQVCHLTLKTTPSCPGSFLCHIPQSV